MVGVSTTLPEKMASELNEIVKDTGRPKSDILKEALDVYLWDLRFKKIRKKLGIKAKALGVVTDEDVFKAIS